MAAIAAFAGIDRTAPGAVPTSLDPSRQEKWRRDLTTAEQLCTAAVTEERSADAALVRDDLPGPMFSWKP